MTPSPIPDHILAAAENEYPDGENFAAIKRAAYIKGLSDNSLLKALHKIVANGMRHGGNGDAVYSQNAQIAREAIASFLNTNSGD